jgi:hypothetical protein
MALIKYAKQNIKVAELSSALNAKHKIIYLNVNGFNP